MSALPIPRSLRAAVALLTIAPALGCSSRPAVLARAGGETITVQDFQDAARGAAGRYPGTPSEAKATLLQDLVGRALLVHAARQRPYIQHEAFDQFRGQIMSQTISQAVIQQLVPEVPVSSAEVAVFEDWQHQFAHAHLIYTPTIQLARSAMAELKKGVPFADVSNRYGIPGMVPAGGDLGFLQNGTMVEPLNAQLREAPLNQPVGPLPAPGEGWFILLVTERRREPKQVEMGPTMYERMIKGRKLRALSAKSFIRLREQYHLRLERGAGQRLFTYFNQSVQDSTGKLVLPREATTSERGEVLARYDGDAVDHGVYTLGDAIEDFQSAGEDRPNLAMQPALQHFVETRCVQRLTAIEARKRHLQEDPEIVREVSRRVDNFLLETLYRTEVADVARPTQADLDEAYRRHAPGLSRIREARMQVIYLPDSTGALGVLERLRGAPTMREGILLASPGLQMHEEVVHWPTTSPVWGPIEFRLKHVPEGTYAGPYPAQGRWLVVQMVSKNVVTPPFGQLRIETQNYLREESNDIAREHRLAAITDSLRKAVPVTIDQERLKRTPWPNASGI